MPRPLLVLLVLAAATALGLWWRARNGRYTAVAPEVARAAQHDDDAPDEQGALLTPADLGVPLGGRATFLQLSSEVCAPCRRTHAVLEHLAATTPGVVHVDLDVVERLDLVHRFSVLRTPTVLVLDARGAVVGRASGAMDRRQAHAALQAAAPAHAGRARQREPTWCTTSRPALPSRVPAGPPSADPCVPARARHRTAPAHASPDEAARPDPCSRSAAMTRPDPTPLTDTPAPPSPRQAPAGVDPRGPRFGAALTAVLLVVVLLLGTGAAATAVLALVAASFALGVARGVGGTWQGVLFRTVIRPRLGAPSELEDPRPPRFAQLVGLVVTGAGLVLALAGIGAAVPVAAAVALVAAFLNAVFGLCLGCELYLLGVRLRART